MKNRKKHLSNRIQRRILFFTCAILIPSILLSSGLVGCSPTAADLEAVDYAPLPGDGWQVSTPEEQGLDPLPVAELYYHAAELENSLWAAGGQEWRLNR